MNKFILLFSLCTCISALYEDQIGMFDWRKQYIGNVYKLYWDQAGGSSGKRMFVATDKNVIASLNTGTGNIVWRRVFEEGRRGEVDDFLYTGNALISILSGTRVQAWVPSSGNLVWEVFLDGEQSHRGRVGYIDEGKKGVVLAMSSDKVVGIQKTDGKELWQVDLPNPDVVNYQKLQVHDGTAYVVGMTTGTEVKVMAIDAEGNVEATKSVIASFLRKETKCEIVQSHLLMCVCPSTESVQVLNLKQPTGFTSTSLQDVSLGDGSAVEIIETTETGTILCKSGGDCALVTVAANNKATTKKIMPKAVLATVVTHEDTEYLLYLEPSGTEELTLSGYDLTSGELMSEFGHKISYAKHNGKPVKAYGLLARRSKDGKMAYKFALVSQDYSLQLLHKTGKVAWRLEESLAYIGSVDMLDLPVSENQAKFEDEFGSHEDNVVTMFMKRVKTQLSQLQTFVVQQLHRLQGVKHHASMVEDEEEDEEDILRDEFSIHKMVVMVTEPGKIVGMRSHTGHIVWQHYIPDLAPFERFGKKKFVFHTQRTTAHFPHSPQCLVLGRNRQSGRGHLFAFNPITGEVVSGMSATGEHLPYNVKQSFLLGEWDEHFLKALVILDDSNLIQVYPSSSLAFVRSHSSHLYMYLADTDNGILNGYRLLNTDTAVTVDHLWTVNLQNQRLNLKITQIVAKASNEHIHSQGRVLGDRSVLYKYLNPNVVVVTTEGEEPATSQQKAYPVINIYVVDVVTGHLIFHGNHRKAQGPLHVVHSENWAVYAYYSTKLHRYEMAVLEMFEGKEQSNSTVFSSFSAPATPLVMRQSFIFPLPMYTMSTTITEKGVTAKDILVALKNGGIFTLPKAFLDPRRPITPTQETQEEGTFPYIPELPVHTEGIINYNQTLFHVRGIHTSPTGLESTSLVLAYGLDLYLTRVQPSKMFDVLKEDFEHWLIASVVLSMLIASFITQKLASRKALNRQWK